MPSRRDNLFDFGTPRGPRKGPAVGADPTETAPLTVSVLLVRVKTALAEALPQRVAVVGEISNFKHHPSGHLYFRLKDAHCAVDAAMFKAHASRLKFEPEDGLEVVAEGRVDVYEVRGQLQLYVERLTPRGAGELELAFRQLKTRLEAQGLFDPARKKPLPRFPRAIGLITSATGAAVRDIRQTLGRRWPATRVWLLPVLVQGDGAARQIAEAIALVDHQAAELEIDTIIVARGGGSLEDLWAFNEECVARAIVAATTPVISGVGHEVDLSIADLVADVRAATPTAAAELAVPDGRELARHVTALSGRLQHEVTTRLTAAKSAMVWVQRSTIFRDPGGPVRTYLRRVDELSAQLRAVQAQRLSLARRQLEPAGSRLAAGHPVRMVERARARVQELTDALRWALGTRGKRAGDAAAALDRRLQAASPTHALRLAGQRITAAERQLEAMSHRSILKRGFSITRTEQGRVLRTAGDAQPGQRLCTELHDGALTSRVEGEDPPRPAPKPRRRPTPTGDQPGLFDHES